MDDNLYTQVEDTQNGAQLALEQVVRSIQDNVHHLSMRILVSPEVVMKYSLQMILQSTLLHGQ